MVGFLLAEKLEQSQMFDETGSRIPVTLLKTSSCHLIDIKWSFVSAESADPQDKPTKGYMAVVLGFGETKKIKKSTQGQFTKAGLKAPLRFLKEIRLDKHAKDIQPVEEEGKKGLQVGETKVFIGQALNPTLFFKVGDVVNVSGVSKGKGFQGVVRRHGFAGGPKTHGQSDRERAPGSIGQTTTPGRVYRGKRMAGHMGEDRVTVQNLKVIKVDDQGLTIKGLVPGHKHTVLEVRS